MTDMGPVYRALVWERDCENGQPEPEDAQPVAPPKSRRRSPANVE